MDELAVLPVSEEAAVHGREREGDLGRAEGELLTALAALSLATAAAWGLALAPAYAQIPVPAHTGLVVDQAGMLSPGLREALSGALLEFQGRVGPQLQLLTVPSLEGEPIESYSIRVTDRWKLGGSREDDGALVVVALQDRAIRIEVGQGLEGNIPDALAGRIVNDVMVPHFRDGRAEEGIVAGFQEVARALGGELRIAAPAGHRRVAGGRFSWLPFIIALFLLFPRLFGGRRGAFLGGLLTGGALGHRRSSGFGIDFGSGGGGFRGGGGGGFSGGGASGRW